MHNHRINKILKNEQSFSGKSHTESQSKSFNKAFHRALEQVIQDQSISFSPIDSWVYVLAIPSTFKYTLDETRQIAKEIQHTILPPKKPRAHFQIITWPEICNAHHETKPSYRDWFHGSGAPLDDGTQFVFFLDSDDIKKHVLSQLANSYISTSNQQDTSLLIVSDGRYELSIPLIELATHAIWTAKQLQDIVQDCIATLKDKFALIQELYDALKTAFPEARFKTEDKKLIMESVDGNHTIDYQRLIDAIRHSCSSPASWLKSLNTSDLISSGSRPSLTLRSKLYLKARPDALHSKEKEYVLVAQKEFASRLFPIKADDSKNTMRYEHYKSEAQRFVGAKSYSGYSFCKDLGNSFVMGIVGDQVASIALYPQLVLGAILTSFNKTKSVRVIATLEDVLVIAHPNTPWSNIEETIQRGSILLSNLFPDGSDPLYFDEHITLPDFACGNFDLLPVPNSYFDLMDTAADESLALPPGRSFYLRGLAFELIRDFGLAEKEFRRAFASNSGDGDVCHALGRALGETGKHQDALPFLRKATLALPDDAEVANSYGLALLNCGYSEQAAKLFERAVQLVPDDPQFLSNLGQSYFMTQRLQEAENTLAKALEVAPSFSDAHSILAQIRWRQGNLGAARIHARKAFAANPGNKGVQDLLWALTVDESK